MDTLKGVHMVLGKRRGRIVDQSEVGGTPMTTVIATLPVAESFGFVSDLRGSTSGKAFPQMVSVMRKFNEPWRFLI